VGSSTEDRDQGARQEPAISVVIPHLNQPDLLSLCLDALARQDIDPQRREILVVDNGSEIRPDPVVAAHPDIRLAREAEPGPGPARNRGVALTRAPLIAFTDADCIPESDWLSRLVARFEAEPETGIIGGEVQVFAADPASPNPAEAFDLIYGFRQARQIERDHFAATANLAVRRGVFEAVGPFGGIDLSEDMEWGQRAHAKGYPTRHAPEAIVRHPARRSMAALQRQWDRHIDHHHRMQAGGLSGNAWWLLRALAVGASPLAEIGTILRSERLPGPRARLLAFGALVQLRAYRARRMIASLSRPARKRRADQVWNRS
jgi:GT2 family glycosyltransferase